MSLSVNVNGLFSLSSSVCVLRAEVGSLPFAESGFPFVIKNHACNFTAASRMEQFSMSATKSRMLPPFLPLRPATHELDWHVQRFLQVWIIKLSLLFSELCIGRGQLPRI